MAQRHGGGISGIDRGQGVGQAEERPDHLADLVLAGRSGAGDRLLDLVGRVLDDVAARSDGLGHCEPARHPDAHRGRDVVLEQHPLDRHHVGAQFCDQRPQFRLDLGKPVRKIERRVGADDAGGHSARRTAVLDTAVPTTGEPRVDP